MIVPQNRLLLWFALLVVPFMLLGAIEPAAVIISASCITAFALMVGTDGLMGRAGLDGISVTLPEVVRVSKDREAKLELRLRNESQKRKRLRLALALPRAMESKQEDLQAELPEGSEWSRLSWPFVPHLRGSVLLDTVHVESTSPLGFWAVQRRLPVRCEVRVYPNLFSDRKSLAALFLNRSALGLHAQRQLGKGREFEKLREYVPGDGYDEIHWKATARRGKPITKVFQIERTQEVYVVMDASRLSARKPEKSAVSSQWSVEPASARQTADYEPLTTDSVLERFITA